MSLVGRLETELEIKAPAASFHDVLSCRPHHISNITPSHIQGCDLHEGEWGKKGTIICWNYMHDGVPEVAKEVIEDINDEKNSTTFKVIEGHLLDNYKNFVLTVQATQKDGGSLVHWTIEFEKQNENVPDPQGIVQLVINMTKDIDAHLIEKA